MLEDPLLNLFDVGIALVNRWEILSKKDKNDSIIFCRLYTNIYVKCLYIIKRKYDLSTFYTKTKQN